MPDFHRPPPPFPLRSKDGGGRWRCCTSNLTVAIIQITMRYKFPWKETPILYGEDAIRFEKEMERVDNMSAEERRANAEALRKRVEKFCKEWNVTIKI